MAACGVQHGLWPMTPYDVKHDLLVYAKANFLDQAIRPMLCSSALHHCPIVYSMADVACSTACGGWPTAWVYL